MLLWIYCFRLFFIRTFVCLSISWSTAWNLGSFKVYSLFSYQCTSSILRIDFRSCSATSEQIFQSHSSLSSLGDSLFTISYRQPFVNNLFIFLLLLSKRLFAFRFRFAISLISISRVDCFVNNFFRLFLNCFNNSENMSIKRAEKEGFEPSRRLTRPIPLAGAPLRPLEYFSKVLIWQYDIVLRRNA